jgi:hypothetical protein
MKRLAQLPRLLLIATVTAFALAAAVPASAATQPAAGNFIEGPESITSERLADGNLIIELTRPVTFTGTFAGGGQVEQRIVIHKDGSVNLNMTIAFTGLACGRPTTLEFLVVGQGAVDENFAGELSGSWTVLKRGPSQDWVPRGNGTFVGQAGVGGTYAGEVHCD